MCHNIHVQISLRLTNFADWMDRQDNCGHIEAYDIQRDETVTIYAKTGDTLSSQGSCSLNFKAIDTDAKVQMQFTTFSIQDCGVTLYITGSGTGKTVSITDTLTGKTLLYKCHIWLHLFL